MAKKIKFKPLKTEDPSREKWIENRELKSKEKKTVRFTFDLDSSFHDSLKIYSIRTKKKMKDIVKEAIINYTNNFNFFDQDDEST